MQNSLNLRSQAELGFFDAMKIFGVLWELIEAVVLAAAIFVIVYWQIAQPNQVKGQSMFPTFHDGEFILTDKISYRFSPPGRGDIVILKSPKNQEIDFIKRIVGLPGEKIKLFDGKVYINEQVLNETNYLEESVFTPQESYLAEDVDFQIPNGQYFVMGDNRAASSDSRDFGPVVRDELVGKVIFRYIPLNKISLISSGKYP